MICKEEYCTNYVEGRTEKCASHNAIDRKAERIASQPVKPKKPIAKRSAKKVKADSEYTALRKKFLEEYPLCQASITGQCDIKSSEVHHISTSAKNYLNTESWLAVCSECHRRIETVLSADFRREKGLLTD